MTEARAEIEILGQRLTVRGRGTPEYIRQLADHLNDRVQGVREQARLQDPLRVSLLAALHLVDDLFRARAAEAAVAARVGRLIAELDGALGEPSGT